MLASLSLDLCAYVPFGIVCAIVGIVHDAFLALLALCVTLLAVCIVGSVH